jgi:hypothetical protein
LDNQASKSVFIEKNLLSNIRHGESSVTFVGIGGTKTTNFIGNCREFGLVSYIPNGVANILSFSEVEKQFRIDYRPSYGFIVFLNNGGEYHFRLNHQGLYVCDFDNFPVFRINHASITLVHTVYENEQLFTKREVEQARIAKDVMRQLAYPSIKDMVSMIKNGVIINLPITIHDIYRAFRIYGPDIAALKGKSKLKKPLAIKPEHIPRPLRSGLVLHSDIFFVDRDPYLITVSTPLGLTVVHHLNGITRGSQLLRKLTDTINLYKMENFSIENILTDGESAMVAISGQLSEIGIRLEVSGSGQHVPVAENKIRQVKERVRSHVATLPYMLPKFFMRWLVFFCVMRLNMLPSKSRSDGILSSIELFKGRKIDYKRDVRIGFGEYVQALNPNITIRNSMVPRTDGAISLLPTGNLQGSVRFYSLSTKKIIVRDHWTAIPMPQVVIDHLNNLALTSYDGQEAPSSPDFAFGKPDHLIPDDGFTGEEDIIVADEVIIDPPLKLSGDGLGDQVIPDPTYEQVEQQQLPLISETVEEIQSQQLIHESVADEIIVEEEQQDKPPESNENVVNSTHQLSHHDDSISNNSEIIESLLEEHLSANLGQRRYNLRTRSERKPNQDQDRYHYSFANIGVRSAIRLYGNHAKQSIKNELEQHIEKGTWKPLTPAQVSELINKSNACDTEDATAAVTRINTMIFSKEKFNATGEFEKIKSRLVARGDMQDKSMYSFEEISAQVATLTGSLSTITIAAREKRKQRKVDVAGAYLNAKIKNKNILIRIEPDLVQIILEDHPEYVDYVQEDGSVEGLLQQALYGCLESAELWYEELFGTFTNIAGYTRNPLDRCIYNKMVPSDDNPNVQCQSTILVYVDDILILCKSQKEIETVTQHLKDAYKKITIEDGPIINYLGMVLNFQFKSNAVQIDMSNYIINCIDAHQIEGIALTPALPNLFEVDSSSELLSTNEKELFHSSVAKLLFCAKRVRHDIMTPIAFLSTRVNSPTKQDMDKLRRILKYLNGVPDLGIVLEADYDEEQGIIIHSYIDASYGVHVDGRSHSGIAVSLGKGCIYIRSAKQMLVTKSSSEAELVAASDEISQVIWLREFLIGQGYQPKQTILYQDNRSTIAMISRGRHTSLRTRHINVRYFFISDRVNKGEIIIKHCPTENMIADLMTKPLQGSHFRKMRCMVMNHGE